MGAKIRRQLSECQEQMETKISALRTAEEPRNGADEAFDVMAKKFTKLDTILATEMVRVDGLDVVQTEVDSICRSASSIRHGGGVSLLQIEAGNPWDSFKGRS